MTNDEQFTALAQLIMDFQTEVKDRFDGVGERMDRFDSRLDNIDGRVKLRRQPHGPS